ncbi:hypothetical protein BBF93_05640 [Hyphomonas sp. CACIAM 19H1]|nr:hypothetical protein BBF93_05640 [Hyphomonas sp. CACIAM 19H1]
MGVAGLTREAEMAESPTISIEPGSRGNANLIYFLYIVAPVFFQILALVGGVMAYLGKGKGDAMIENHYRNQINIFWKMLLYCVISGLLTFLLIGLLLFLAALVWYIVRIVKGMQALAAGEMVENPDSWLL